MLANSRWLDVATPVAQCVVLESIMSQVLSAEPETSFNSALINLYNGGDDSLAWHSDDEPCYGTNPCIASVSLGSPRFFDLRELSDHSASQGLILQPGSLLVMSGPMQHHWQHAVPKQQGNTGYRINITFRYILG